mgnify:CR=1 FL=1
MQTGPRSLGASSLEVRISMALPTRMRARTREITKVHTDPEAQRRGDATRLLEQVCSEADALGITLVLWPKPYGDDIALSQAQLIAWYGKHGFLQIQPEPPLMARMPCYMQADLTPNPLAAAAACYG